MAAPDDISAEDRLIARFFEPIATDPWRAWAIRRRRIHQAATEDAISCSRPMRSSVESISFPEDAPQAVASKALRVNLSDLAAKGARPLGFLLSLAIPKDIKEDWLGGFAEGLRGDAVLFGCPLFGGDTDRTPGPVTVSIAMFGSVPEGTMVRRAGAKAGDRVFVTGTIGDAALGVALRGGKAKTWKLNDAQRQHLMSRYLLPQPRNVLAEAIRNHASAAMDISDGLVGDFGKLCRASGVAADINIASVPVSDAAKTVIAGDAATLELVLTGGDDYEIICTVPNKKAESFRAAAKAAGVPVTELGEIKTGKGARFIDAAGKPLVFKRASFSHF